MHYKGKQYVEVNPALPKEILVYDLSGLVQVYSAVELNDATLAACYALYLSRNEARVFYDVVWQDSPKDYEQVELLTAWFATLQESQRQKTLGQANRYVPSRN